MTPITLSFVSGVVIGGFTTLFVQGVFCILFEWYMRVHEGDEKTVYDSWRCKRGMQ